MSGADIAPGKEGGSEGGLGVGLGPGGDSRSPNDGKSMFIATSHGWATIQM